MLYKLAVKETTAVETLYPDHIYIDMFTEFGAHLDCIKGTDVPHNHSPSGLKLCSILLPSL